MDLSNPVNRRFVELATNKDITDEELSEELCYLYARWKANPNNFTIQIKSTRETNPKLIMGDLSCMCDENNKRKFNSTDYEIEKYEMKQRIRSLEQTLATFMEQTKADRLVQDLLIQSLSKELDEFQDEFYDCQADIQHHTEQLGVIEDSLKETIETVSSLEPGREEVIHPYGKDKMA